MVWPIIRESPDLWVDSSYGQGIRESTNAIRGPAWAGWLPDIRRAGVPLQSCNVVQETITATTAAYTAKKISPMLAVANMEETLSFYHDILGFRVATKSPGYAIVERDGQTIHL